MRFRMLKKFICALLVAAPFMLFLALIRTPELTSPVTARVTNLSAAKQDDVRQDAPSHDDSTFAPIVWSDIRNRQQDNQEEAPEHSPPEGRNGTQDLHEQPERMQQVASFRFIPYEDAKYSTPSPVEDRTGPQDLWDRIILGVGHGIKPHMEERAQPTTCTPKHHVLFLKVHKTGSSTVANIVQRFGFTRQLNFVLPRRRLHSSSYNYLNMPGQQLTLGMIIPPPRGQHYDILWNHVTYDGPFFQVIMPEDTVYVSILREPLEQFQSAFEYYGQATGTYLHAILHKNVTNPLSEFISQPYRYQSPKSYLSYVRNKQAQDFGMQAKHVLNSTLRQQYIQRLGQDFQLVMITEYFDQSLVLLRRLLCWEVKDILYIPKNKNSRKKKRMFTEADRINYRKYSTADYDLYDFFRQRFEKTLQSQDVDFHAEVGFFKDLLQKVQLACTRHGGMTISDSPWNAPFKISMQDCNMMLKSELPFLDDIIMDAVKRYKASR